MTSERIKKALQKVANKEKATILKKFFKTGKGEYGEGDVFIGVTVPEQRKIAKTFLNTKLTEIKKLLDSPIHEHRLTALLILTYKFQKATEQEQEQIIKLYLQKTKRINNWDLVDLSASQLLGNYLLNKKRNVLYELAQSNNLWEKRIAIIATFSFIKKGETKDTYKLAKKYLTETHDLLHKATGWMLRETAKKVNQEELEAFLQKNIKQIPRTTLRYAIERFEETKRQYYLKL